jgi:hypothetical protein
MRMDGTSIQLDAGLDCTLQASESLAGPWLNVGKGQKFTVKPDMPTQFFKRFRRVGGLLYGTVSDATGGPLCNVTLGLPYGGPTATTDSDGAFGFPRLPWGQNVIAVSSPIGATLDVVLPATNNTAANLKVAMAAAGPTNACNCLPWCAIGFGSLPGGQTPIYYSGGANPPKAGPANCGEVLVTVTPPSGAKFPIVPGTSRHQNSGPNPAPGVWTVTTTVCGQTKSCTITFP